MLDPTKAHMVLGSTRTKAGKGNEPVWRKRGTSRRSGSEEMFVDARRNLEIRSLARIYSGFMPRCLAPSRAPLTEVADAIISPL